MKIFTSKTGEKRVVFWILVLAVILGFVAGIAGEIFARSFIFSYLSQIEQIAELNSSFYELLAKYDFLTKEKKEGPIEIVIRKPRVGGGLATVEQVETGNFLENLEGATVTFFPANLEMGQDLLFSAYQKRNSLGRGFVLTNDGWLVTTNQVLANLKSNYVAVTAKGGVYEVNKLVGDPLTAAVFAKIEANNLPVLNLAKDEKINLNQAFVVLDKEGGVRISEIENNYYRKVNYTIESIVSSDSLDNYYLPADQLSNVFLGEAVVDQNGRVIGLVIELTGRKLILPLTNFASEVDEVLRAGEISRVELGIDYLNLHQLIINPEVDSSYKDLSRGALVYANAQLGFRGVDIESPVAKAGLQPGDVILKVEGEEINNNVSLSQLVQTYNIGDEIELTVWQNGSENKIRVVLTEL